MKRLTILGAVISAISLSSCAVTTAGVTKGDERNFIRSLDDITAGKAIKARIQRADVPNLGGVDVEVAEGIVLLAGTVPTQEDRIEAERIAWSAPNVEKVGNEILIKNDKGFIRTTKDGVLQTSVRTRLTADKYVKGRNINIETHEGVVYLLGVARSPQELERIAAIASTTKGAKEVISYIKVHGDNVQSADLNTAPPPAGVPANYPAPLPAPLPAPASGVPLHLQSAPQAGPQPVSPVPYNVPQLPKPTNPAPAQVAGAAPDTEPYYRDPVTGERITLTPGTQTIPYRPNASAGLSGALPSGPTAPAQLPGLGDLAGKAFPTDNQLGAFRTGGAGDAVSVIESEPYYIDPSTGKEIPIKWIRENFK